MKEVESKEVRGIRPAQAAKKLGIGLSTLYLRVKNDPDFPKIHKRGPRVSVFLEHELDNFLVNGKAK